MLSNSSGWATFLVCSWRTSIAARLPRTRTSHTSTQMRPSEPTTRNVPRQPRTGLRKVTTSGVSTAPTAAPELKMPLPRLRALGGRTRAVTAQCARPVERFADPQEGTASKQPAQAGHDRRRRSSQRPPRDRRGIRPAQVPAVDQITRGHLKECVSHRERRQNPTEFGEAADGERFADLPPEQGDRLPVHIIEHGRGEHQPAEHPGPCRGLFGGFGLRGRFCRWIWRGHWRALWEGSSCRGFLKTVPRRSPVNAGGDQ